MKIAKTIYLYLSLTVFSVGSVVGQGKQASSVQATAALQPQATTSKPATAAVAQDPGERKFQVNCSRCHNPPEQLSPRIVGTVARHMRVRASLSAEDERDILRYLAP